MVGFRAPRDQPDGTNWTRDGVGMTNIRKPSVVVGIDGSESSIQAAQWAADEAIARSVPLRLISVIKATHPSKEDYYDDLHHAQQALQAAQAALEATGKPVKVEAEVRDGLPGVTLVSESAGAEMICVGTVGRGRYAQSILGSTATEVAEKAHCPVAVVRAAEGEAHEGVNWIVTERCEDPDDQTVIEYAIEEARLRSAPVLILGDERTSAALDSAVQSLRGRYPDVDIFPVATGADIARFIKKHDEPIQLAVIGAAKADQMVDIVGSYGQRRRRVAASVLIVRRGS